MPFAPPTQKAPPAVPNGEALVIHASSPKGATLPQVIQQALTVARVTKCAVRSTWNNQEVYVTPEDTYQGAQRRVGKEQSAKS